MRALLLNFINKINYKIYRLKYRNARRLNLTKPVDVSLELASFCSAACIFCYHSDQKNLPFEKGMMKFETAYQILREAAEVGVHSIKLNWKGESTMNPKFRDIAEAAYVFSDRSTFIDRVTNSNFNFKSNHEDIFIGLCYQTKVKVSFDSFRKDILETQRKGTNYERALFNIKKFHDHPNRKNTKLVIQSVRTQANKDEDLEYEIKSRFPDAEVSIRDVVEGRVDKDLSSSLVKDRPKERQACVQAFSRLVFDWRGYAHPCCVDIKESINLGSIHDTNLLTIWSGIKARQLRNDLKSGNAFKKEPCKTCSSHESYKGWTPPKES